MPSEDIQYEFIDSTRGGQLLMIDDYTFSRINKTCYVWSCSAKSSLCKARVRLSASNVITDYILEHNHPPPKYFKTVSGSYVKYYPISYITKPNGTVLLLLQGYTFFRTNKKSYVWLCSSYRSNCKAKIRLTKYQKRATCAEVHNHSPPVYVKSGGKYFKML